MKAEYRIIQSVSPDYLEREVNDLMNDGWSIAGGVAVSSDSNGTRYIQAIVKVTLSYEEEEAAEEITFN